MPPLHRAQLQSWTVNFGPAVMAQLYLDATPWETSTTSQGRQRTQAGEFIRRAKQLEREQQQR